MRSKPSSVTPVAVGALGSLMFPERLWARRQARGARTVRRRTAERRVRSIVPPEALGRGEAGLRPARARAVRGRERVRSLHVGEVNLEGNAHLHRVLAGALELGARRTLLEAVPVGELELRVVGELGLGERV